MYFDCGVRKISAAVLEAAARDAKRGDPIAACWLLTRDAELFADAFGIEDGFLGRLAGICFMEII